jgi:hypothetical protein
MQFVTLAQAQQQPYTHTYKHSSLTSLVALLVVLAIAAVASGFGYQAWSEGAVLGVVVIAWVLLWAVLFLFLIARTLRGRMHPSNWLVRAHSTGLSIKFRSYLNRHFDPNDAIVVLIPYTEIEYVRDHRIRRDVPGTRGSTEMHFLRFAEFKLKRDDDLERLREAVAAERMRKAPLNGRVIRHRAKDLDYPVQIADGFLRIEWRVWPRLTRFIQDISGYVTVQEPLKTREDFVQLKAASRRQQEDALLRLAAAGSNLAAIRIIKGLYGYDTRRAVQFLRELTNPM